MVFSDRTYAGRLLADKLLSYREETIQVLGLSRGGVPVAAVIAEVLEAPLDVILVRKIGAPFNPELALGALCENAEPILTENLLAQVHLTGDDLIDIMEAEKKEIRRQKRKVRKGRDLKNIKGQTILVVDDGLATGSTMSAAVRYLRNTGAGKIIAAVPIASTRSADCLRKKVDEFVALEENDDLMAVSHWYDDFEPVSDQEVLSYLKRGFEQKHASKPRLSKLSMEHR